MKPLLTEEEYESTKAVSSWFATDVNVNVYALFSIAGSEGFCWAWWHEAPVAPKVPVSQSVHIFSRNACKDLEEPSLDWHTFLSLYHVLSTAVLSTATAFLPFYDLSLLLRLMHTSIHVSVSWINSSLSVLQHSLAPYESYSSWLLPLFKLEFYYICACWPFLPLKKHSFPYSCVSTSHWLQLTFERSTL